ncbi:MAG: carboxyl-terminal processing protease [Halieaceae bacterium]|jgi:carboxyl-terminal processing protease
MTIFDTMRPRLHTLALAVTLALAPLASSAQNAPADEIPLTELRTFADVFNQIRVKYVEEIDDKTLLESAIRGMLSGLDPHSSYLTDDAFEDLQTNTKGEFSGLGIEITTDNGYIKVISPIDETPAQRAGIEAGDLIIQLDNEPVKGMGIDEAIERMRGPLGSSIDVTIAREGESQPFTLTLTRDIVKVVSVRKRWLEPGYGYVRIAQFQARTGQDVSDALKSLMDEQELNGLVLDLRNNPGGVLGASVDVAGHFLEGGTVVYTEGRLEASEVRYNATSQDTSDGAPLVVLINGGSASASEIVAGALQDHRRAIIMGTKSFGKGSVQTVLPLSEHKAIKLTTALYFTPNGRSIQATGIEPDISIKRAKVTEFRTRPRLTEADLSGHLDNANGNERDADEEMPKPNSLLESDNQLYEALTLLKGIHILGFNSQG